MSASVLIVEDENKIASLVSDYLQQDHFNTSIINHGDDVMPWLSKNLVDLVLLDIMLPGTDGISLCRQIRAQSELPVIFMTARVEEIDRLLGLELGADDYVCKPFSPRELVARVKAVLRRSSGQASDERASRLHLDEETLKVRVGQWEVGLTGVEFQLLRVLVTRPGVIYSRQQLMDNIYSDQRVVSDRTIDSHIKKLRKKLASHDHIQSVYGVGYKFEPASG